MTAATNCKKKLEEHSERQDALTEKENLHPNLSKKSSKSCQASPSSPAKAPAVVQPKRSSFDWKALEKSCSPIKPLGKEEYKITKKNPTLRFCELSGRRRRNNAVPKLYWKADIEAHDDLVFALSCIPRTDRFCFASASWDDYLSIWSSRPEKGAVVLDNRFRLTRDTVNIDVLSAKDYIVGISMEGARSLYDLRSGMVTKREGSLAWGKATANSLLANRSALFYGTREGSVFRDDLREDPRLSAAVLRSGDSMGAITSLRTHPVEGFGILVGTTKGLFSWDTRMASVKRIMNGKVDALATVALDGQEGSWSCCFADGSLYCAVDRSSQLKQLSGPRETLLLEGQPMRRPMSTSSLINESFVLTAEGDGVVRGIEIPSGRHNGLQETFCSPCGDRQETITALSGTATWDVSDMVAVAGTSDGALRLLGTGSQQLLWANSETDKRESLSAEDEPHARIHQQQQAITEEGEEPELPLDDFWDEDPDDSFD